MLANDPHLGTSIPSFWQLNELRWEDKFLSGASCPGVPLIPVGRGKTTSYGMTSPNCDTSDVWQETLDGDSYLVDGSWRPLKTIVEQIKMKGTAEPLNLIVRFTHRGVIITPELLLGAEGVFFAASLPVPKFKHSYSLAWGGDFPGDEFTNIILDFANGIGTK